MKLIVAVLLVVVACAAVVYFVYFSGLGFSDKNIKYDLSLNVVDLNYTCSAKNAIRLEYRLTLNNANVVVDGTKVTERVYNSQDQPEGFSESELNFVSSGTGKTWTKNVIYCLSNGNYYSNVTINAILGDEAVQEQVVREFVV
jgi:hypothetical protein